VTVRIGGDRRYADNKQRPMNGGGGGVNKTCAVTAERTGMLEQHRVFLPARTLSFRYLRQHIALRATCPAYALTQSAPSATPPPLYNCCCALLTLRRMV